MTLFIGIDGGGSKTDCVVGDETSLLGRAQSGTCKIQRVGPEQAREALQSAVIAACRAAGVPPGEVHSCSVGLAGASDEKAQLWARQSLSEILSGSITVTGDHVIAHEAAFVGRPGVVVISGTGSIAYGVNEQQKAARAGGWGPVISDEGSGTWVGRNTVALLIRGLHESPEDDTVNIATETPLFRGITDAWHCAGRDDLVRVANTSPAPDFAALFPLVQAAAEAGDGSAREILAGAGRELGTLAAEVARCLWNGNPALPFALDGGVCRNSPFVRLSFEQSVQKLFPGSSVNLSQNEPAIGALSLARKASNNQVRRH